MLNDSGRLSTYQQFKVSDVASATMEVEIIPSFVVVMSYFKKPYVMATGTVSKKAACKLSASVESWSVLGSWNRYRMEKLFTRKEETMMVIMIVKVSHIFAIM